MTKSAKPSPDGRGRAKKKRRRVVAPRLDDFVEEMLASLHSYTQVVDQAVVEFECDESTVKRSIMRVRDAWKAADGASREEKRARFRAELEHAWRGALGAGDYRAIAAMARVRADIEGLRTPSKLELSGTLGLRPVAALSPQEREQELRMLLAKRAAALGERPAVLDPMRLDEPQPAEFAGGELSPDARAVKAAKQRKAPRIH